MGKNFDNLIELVRSDLISHAETNLDKNIRVRQDLERIASNAALFEFPLNAEDIFPRSGKESSEYDNYLADYLEISKKYGRQIIMPYKITAIEDKLSMVCFENIGDNNYIMFDSRNYEKNGIHLENFLLAQVDIHKESFKNIHHNFQIKIHSYYELHLANKKVIPMDLIINDPRYLESLKLDVAQSAVSYFEQLVYIMDPANFIIKKESNQSRIIGKKIQHKKMNPYRKTVIRPHFICLNENDLKDFLSDESKEPRPFHPVRGHWKVLMSERYVNKRGQRIFVEQFFRGNTKIEGKKGWNYQILIKESPVDIVSYKE